MVPHYFLYYNSIRVQLLLTQHGMQSLHHLTKKLKQERHNFRMKEEYSDMHLNVFHSLFANLCPYKYVSVLKPSSCFFQSYTHYHFVPNHVDRSCQTAVKVMKTCTVQECHLFSTWGVMLQVFFVP